MIKILFILSITATTCQASTLSSSPSITSSSDINHTYNQLRIHIEKLEDELYKSYFRAYCGYQSNYQQEVERAQEDCFTAINAIPNIRDVINPEHTKARSLFGEITSFGSPKLVDMFLEKRFDPTHRPNKRTYSPVETAARCANIRVLKHFINREYKVSTRSIRDLASRICNAKDPDTIQSFFQDLIIADAVNFGQVVNPHLKCLELIKEQERKQRTQKLDKFLAVFRRGPRISNSEYRVALLDDREDYPEAGYLAPQLPPEGPAAKCFKLLHKLGESIFLSGCVGESKEILEKEHRCLVELQNILRKQNTTIDPTTEYSRKTFNYVCAFGNQEIFDIFIRMGFKVLLEQGDMEINGSPVDPIDPIYNATLYGNSEVLASMERAGAPLSVSDLSRIRQTLLTIKKSIPLSLKHNNFTDRIRRAVKADPLELSYDETLSKDIKEFIVGFMCAYIRDYPIYGKCTKIIREYETERHEREQAEKLKAHRRLRAALQDSN